MQRCLASAATVATLALVTSCAAAGIADAHILEAIAGIIKPDSEGEEPYAAERDGGSWLLSGAMPVDEMAEKIGIALAENRAYATAAGFVLAQLQHLPKTGESIETKGWRFEVVDLDGRRIDKILASPLSRKRRALNLSG